ncbi:Nicotinamide riboside transporter PnuC [candidate division SR1 bacterium Aalborg_AAW-1]|nr:Nicotinamide riboside transporter PnuC [candidate division SR1 bacterium Aalborg_AAW-1]
MSYIEFVGTLFNILCVYLVSKNKIRNRPVGLIGSLLYVALFYQIQLYADLGEQLYFIVTGFYGWYIWSKHGNQQQSDKNITLVENKNRILYIVGIAITTLLLAYITSHLHIRFNNLFPQAASYILLDSFTTILSFAATILMIRQKVEAWVLWIIVDIIGIYLYFIKGVHFIAIEYILFLGIAIGGLIKWYSLYKKQKDHTFIS